MNIREKYLRLIEAVGDDEKDRADRAQSADPFGKPASGKVKHGTEYGDTQTAYQKPQDDPGSTTGEFDPTSMAGNVPVGAKPGGNKPSYDGHFVGQTVVLGRKYVPKKVGWKDKETGEKKFGQVQSSEVSNQWVWDGEEWIRPNAYDDRTGHLKTVKAKEPVQKRSTRPMKGPQDLICPVHGKKVEKRAKRVDPKKPGDDEQDGTYYICPEYGECRYYVSPAGRVPILEECVNNFDSMLEVYSLMAELQKVNG